MGAQTYPSRIRKKKVERKILQIIYNREKMKFVVRSAHTALCKTFYLHLLIDF